MKPCVCPPDGLRRAERQVWGLLSLRLVPLVAQAEGQQDAQYASDGVGRQIHPVAGACGGAIGLQQFDASAQGHHAEVEAQGTGHAGACLVAAAVFCPQDESQRTVHDQMRPFVDEVHLAQRGFRRCEERQISDNGNEYGGYRVFFYQFQGCW